jgi:GNAT superfamily N-acetyltransferase
MITFRLLDGDDLAQADELRRLAGWNQTIGDWRDYLQLAPDGCFMAEVDGQLAGTVTTICYGTSLAWIGMVLVHPDRRRMGLGTALLIHAIEHLKGRGIKSIKLDATPAGKPLYEKLGFHAEYDLFRYEGTTSPMTKRDGWPMVREVAHVTPALVELDAACFGHARREMLRTVYERESARRYAAYSQLEPSGFLFLRPGADAVQAGPFSAGDRAEAAALLGTAFNDLPLGRIFIDVPGPNREAGELMREMNFIVQRTLTRMYLGENPSPGRPMRSFGISGPEMG